MSPLVISTKNKHFELPDPERVARPGFVAQLVERRSVKPDVVGSSPTEASILIYILHKGGIFYLKEISKEEVQILEKNNLIHNTVRGYVNRRGESVGFYRTRNKRYIEDRFADTAKRLLNEAKK